MYWPPLLNEILETEHIDTRGFLHRKWHDEAFFRNFFFDLRHQYIIIHKTNFQRVRVLLLIYFFRKNQNQSRKPSCSISATSFSSRWSEMCQIDSILERLQLKRKKYLHNRQRETNNTNKQKPFANRTYFCISRQILSRDPFQSSLFRQRGGGILCVVRYNSQHA